MATKHHHTITPAFILLKLAVTPSPAGVQYCMNVELDLEIFNGQKKKKARSHLSAGICYRLKFHFWVAPEVEQSGRRGAICPAEHCHGTILRRKRFTE